MHHAHAQQGLNNLWMGGYASWAGPPYGGVDLEFSSGLLEINSLNRDIGFFRTNANITDANGNLLFSTNGAFVANALGDTMLNGAGLNPGPYVNSYPEGIFIPQGVLLLPKPNAPGIYYLIHMTIDNSLVINAEHLLLTTVDLSLDGGMGGVVSKNVSILDQEISLGHLTAVRHANGRDWWAFCRKLNTNTFYRYLISPVGINLDGTQSIGMLDIWATGQVCFSPDGTMFAYYWRDIGFELFQFDRCTGLFSSPVSVAFTDHEFGNGAAFSPSGRFLYITDVYNVYQYDTEAPDMAASEVLIAEWDSTYSPFPPFATLFDIAHLAPDGKIYIGTGNSTDKLHVIHEPDLPGLACNMEQNGVALPRYFSNSLPNHPNYHLGPVPGSVCDSLGMGVMELQAPLPPVNASPNPTTGGVMLTYGAQRTAGELQVLDPHGRMVLREKLPQWSTLHNVQLSNQPPGMYQCRLQWGGKSTSVRVILTEP